MSKRIAILSATALVTVGAVWAILSWPGPSFDPELLAKLAPGESYFYLSIPNDPARGEEYKKSNLHRLIHHPEVRAFVEPIEKQVRELVNKDDMVKKTTGLTIDEITSLLGGPLGLAVFDATLQSQPMPNLAISISAEDGARIKEAMDKVRKKLGAEPGWTTKESVVHGHTVVSLGEDPMGLHYALLGRTVLASPSKPHLELLLERLVKKTPGSLAENARFQGMRKKLAPADRAMATAYISLSSLWARFKEAIPPDADKVIESLGVRDFSAFGLSFEYDLPQIRERYVFMTGRQDRGLVKFFAGTPRDDAFLPYVPKDASGYGYLSLSFGELYDTIARLTQVSRDAAEGFDSAMKEFGTRMGFNLRKDFLGKLGPSWTMYARPVGSKSESVFIVGLEDAKGFFSALEKLLAHGEVQARREEFQGQPMITVTLFPKGGPPPGGLPPELFRSFDGVSVVFLARDSRLFIGMTPEEPATFAARVSTKGPSIRENARFAEILGKVPKQSDFLMLQDYGASIVPAIEALSSLPPDALGPLQDPKTGKPLLAPDRLPKAETLKHLIGVAATFKHTEPDAIVVESISDVGGFSVPAVVGGGMVAALLVPAVTKATERAKVTSCANNLSQMWKLQHVYMSQFGGRLKKMPAATGGAFWLALTKTEPPIIDETVTDILVCPLSGRPARPGFTTYRGPKADVSTLKPEDVVGCCDPGSHPGGAINVLLKSGDVIEATPGDPLYEKALKGTQR